MHCFAAAAGATQRRRVTDGSTPAGSHFEHGGRRCRFGWMRESVFSRCADRNVAAVSFPGRPPPGRQLGSSDAKYTRDSGSHDSRLTRDLPRAAAPGRKVPART